MRGYVSLRTVKMATNQQKESHTQGHYLVLLSWSGASQNNQPPSPVLHVVQEAQLAPLNQQRVEMGCRYIDEPHL